VLIHGGGWKKLESLAVDNATFKNVLKETCGVSSVCNYYGMVEQTGSIFMECAHGVLHASVFSDVLVRDPVTFSPLGTGKPGLLQLVSILPWSYPGHSILTEDIGEVLGIDNCPCGRKGRYFRVLGRAKNAEVRGCSDVYASH
jgi:phenylacetate-coenzyme A ligase PaaK-like adenylate-forming protein